jgi:hypothetical protein
MSTFISYSSKDRKFVDALLVHTKKNKKIDPWVSHEQNISAGADFKKIILDAIEVSSSAIIFISKSYLNSEFIQQNEIPKIFEKINADSTYKAIFFIVDNADVKSNYYLSNIQLANTPSTPLDSMTTNQYLLKLDESILGFQDRPNNLSRKRTLRYITSLIVGIIAIALVSTSLRSTRESLIETPIPNTVTTIIEKEEPLNKGVNVKSLLCLKSTNINSFVEGEEGEWAISDFSNNQLVWGPQRIDKMKTNLIQDINYEYVDCKSLHEAEILYRDSISYIETGTDGRSNFDQLAEIRYKENLNCFNYFNDAYSLGYKTQYEYRVLYMQGVSPDIIEFFCLVIKEEINGETWLTWSSPLSEFDYEQYKIDNMITSILVEDLKFGDCILRPEYFTSKNNSYNPDENIFKRTVSKIPCYNAHDHEVINILDIPKDTFETEIEFERYMDDQCFNTMSIYEFLIDSPVDPDQQVLSFWFMTDFNNTIGDYYRFICFATPYGVFNDYKANFALGELLRNEIYQMNTKYSKNEEGFTISNCPEAVIKDEKYLFNFSWRGLEEPISQIEIIFMDEVAEYVYSLNPKVGSIFEKLVNYDLNLGIEYEMLTEQTSQGTIEASISYGNGKILKAFCKMEITSK